MWRYIAAGVVAVCGWLALNHALATAQLPPISRSTLALLGGTADENTRNAERLLSTDMPADKVSRAHSYAIAAIRRDATEVRSVAILAALADYRHNKVLAARLLRYGDSLSRRNFMTNIGLIEDAVAREDISGALKHYDAALRTTPGSAEALFPTLSAAIAEPAVRQALVALLRSRPAWSDLFQGWMVTNGPNFTAAADMVVELKRAGVPVSRGVEDGLMANLVKKGLGDRAWSHYLTLYPGAKRSEIRNGAFLPGANDTSPFAWALGEDGSPGIEDPGVLTFVGSENVAVIARQVQFLPIGSYRLDTIAMSVRDMGASSLPFWKIACLHSEQSLGRVALGPVGDAGTMFSGRFAVPDNCPVQVLELVSPATDGPSDIPIAVDSVRITATSQR